MLYFLLFLFSDSFSDILDQFSVILIKPDNSGFILKVAKVTPKLHLQSPNCICIRLQRFPLPGGWKLQFYHFFDHVSDHACFARWSEKFCSETGLDGRSYPAEVTLATSKIYICGSQEQVKNPFLSFLNNQKCTRVPFTQIFQIHKNYVNLDPNSAFTHFPELQLEHCQSSPQIFSCEENGEKALAW